MVCYQLCIFTVLHSNNRISADAAIVVSKVLPVNDTLRVLKVSVSHDIMLYQIASCTKNYTTVLPLYIKLSTIHVHVHWVSLCA